jgi:hypothetical protein
MNLVLSCAFVVTFLLNAVICDEDLVHMIKQGRFKRDNGLATRQTCDILNAACRQQIDRNSNRARFEPNFKGNTKCDYDDQTFWLIPGAADNSTCTRTETIAKGLKIRVLNDTVKISPNPVRLPACFDISFEVEINEGIRDIPNSFIGKNEFQLYELPDIEKMQCQNASNDGCGGYGNNCIYCDMCEQFSNLNDAKIDTKDEATDKFLSQFDDVKCPGRPGRYLVSRRLCFNDWSVLDRDGNCKLDMLESLTENDSEADAETLKLAYSALQSKGYSTLISRFYLAHNSTAPQRRKMLTKEQQIRADWVQKLQQRRVDNAWQVTDEEFVSFVDWYVKFQRDTWHRDSYLPWLMYTNELACLKVTFTVCDKEPIAVAPDTSPSAATWFRRRIRPNTRCSP